MIQIYLKKEIGPSDTIHDKQSKLYAWYENTDKNATSLETQFGYCIYPCLYYGLNMNLIL